MPGYTHLQRAQPVLFAHHLLAYVEMLRARRARASHTRAPLPNDAARSAAARSPASPYPIDRAWVADELGFAAISANSIDAVSDRDFVVEFISALRR